jgi:hypothetical protein
VARVVCAEKDEPLQLVLMCSTAAGLEQAKKLASNLLDTIRTDWEKYRCAHPSAWSCWYRRRL